MGLSQTGFSVMINKFFIMLIIFIITLAVNNQSQFAMQEKSKQTTQAERWSEDGIIDIHAHIGSYKGYDLSTPTLVENIQRYGIRLALISNIDGAELPGTTLNLDEIKANQATAAHVRQYPHKLRGLVWTRRRRPAGEGRAVFSGFTRCRRQPSHLRRHEVSSRHEPFPCR
jgi:predicted TIM-barrel fold metal-dependent hydrolase